MTILIADSTLNNSFNWFLGYGLPTEEILPMAEALDEFGFFSLDVGDSDGDFSYGSPWGKLKALRQKVTKTPMQITLREPSRPDQRKFSEKRIEEFVKIAVKSGISVIRIYNVLNEISYLETTVKTIKEYGVAVQGTILYSDLHQTPQIFAAMAAKLEKFGCGSVCVLDSAGLLSPAAVSDLVKTIKSNVQIPLALHSQCNKGVAPVVYYAAAGAGVDILDTALSAFSRGFFQPATESMALALKGTPYDTGLDISKIEAIGSRFAALREKYRSPLALESDIRRNSTLDHQIAAEILASVSKQLMEIKEDIRKLGLRSQELLQNAGNSSPAAPAMGSPLEFSVELEGEKFNFKVSSVPAKPTALEIPKEIVAISEGSVVSPMPGVVLSINFKVGDLVSEGDLVATVEAMKMHYEIYSAYSGIVTEVTCSEGDVITAEAVLMVVKPVDK